MAQAQRHLHIPNANSPQLLTRLLEMLARGVRSTRGLQEALGVEPRTVQYYSQAGQWLGLVDAEDHSALTPLGVEFVYAGPKQAEVYARAVWGQPLAAELLAAADGDVPAVDDILAAVFVAEPDLAPATARRRASAVRTLIAPAAGFRSVARAPKSVQLDLPLGLAPEGPQMPQVILGAGRDWNPDVYRYLLGALLDHGELSLGHVRALLDRAGATELPIGGYVDMALARGDAHRIEDRIVISDDAIARADLVDSTGSIILSDPGYRAYLDAAVEALSGDRHAEIKRDQHAARYRAWDQRVFGHALQPEQVREDLERVLLDRSLDSFPMAHAGSPQRVPVTAPFLDVWQQSNLVLACPPTLAQLQSGLAGVNRAFKQARQGRVPVGHPTLSDRPKATHGGLLHPGEPLPRSVPDTRSLRLRTLLCAPYPALLGALLLLHRLRPDRVDVVQRSAGWEVRWRGRRRGGLLSLLDAFGRSRGWAVSRRSGGLDAGVLIRSLEAVGIAWVGEKRVVLEEKFFGQLRRQPEELEVFEQLQPLAVALEDWLDASSTEEP